MVERMRIAEDVFRISKQGFEVGSASPLQLAFSEAWEGLIPAAKGVITGPGTYPLPEAGFIPIIYLVGGGSYAITVSAAKSSFVVSGGGGTVRYVVFKNRQF